MLAPLRERLGASVPSFGELVIRGAEATLREIEGQDAARASRLETFVARLQTPSLPQLAEAHAVRHATRVP